jgi:hypothetical protein
VAGGAAGHGGGWNMQHLAKVKTRREINAANQLNGHKPIDIATPEEML